MAEGVWQEFDGYADLVEAIEVSRKYGLGYTVDKDASKQYIDRLHPARIELRVSDIIDRTATTKTLRFVPVGGYLPPFLAGQYVALFVDIDGIKTTRPYSISSPPNQTGYWDLTVRRVEGGLVSNFLLDKVARGDVFESTGPCGQFYYNPLFHEKEAVLVAGGSGITPFMSRITEIVEKGLGTKVDLFYGNRSLDDAIFHEELTALAARFENINYHPVIENPPAGYNGLTGFMTGDLIKGALNNLENKTFYLCGPQAMYDFCLPEIGNLGLPARKVRREVYGPPLNVCDSPEWPEAVAQGSVFKVKVSGGPSFEAKADQPLLTALEKNGLAVPSECRSGECSMCRVKVLSGKVYQPAGALVRKSDRRFGYVHSCVSFPLEDLEIMI